MSERAPAAPPTWILETARTGYALGLSPEGAVVHTYWGPKLPRAQDYPRPTETAEWSAFNQPAHLLREEYPAQGGPKYVEACLSATFADGNRDLDLRYLSATQDADGLTIVLRDAAFALELTLHYKVHAPYPPYWRQLARTSIGSTVYYLACLRDISSDGG
ncbi:glycoside hydrolase family 36 N-terminal domain-containing protein [Deinococcus sp.]|uniref:glycoside hydrolase family 36 N-terminal domain-containing protein n=1 Tax=Deinococcus sp. TaxID=47478 RepID=UPI003CC615B7